MDLGANKTPAKIIKEDPFGGTYLRDIYSSVNGKWFRKSWKKIWWAKQYWSEVLLLKLLWY